MQKAKLTYTAFMIGLMLAAAYLYVKGLNLKSESFGLGLSYVLPAVICLGLAIMVGFMALLEPKATTQPNTR